MTFLSLRIAADHLHFCLDGSEPFVSIHGVDVDAHDLSVSNHDDVDAELMTALLKDVPAFLAPLALLGLFFFLLAPQLKLLWVRPEPLPVTASGFHYLRPPLRGPPR